MHKKETVFQKIMSVLVVILGNMIYALALKLFLLPSDLMTGGTTGIALAVKHYTGFNISGVILIFNIAMLIVGFIVLGKKICPDNDHQYIRLSDLTGIFQPSLQ